MCTVSFIARQRGYLLAMNRDEKRTRAPGLPPRVVTVNGRKVVCPSEPGGGAWISLNDAGVAFALINWYAVKDEAGPDRLSRGEVVRSLGAHVAPAEAAAMLARLPLRQMNAFRLIGVFPAARRIFEWRWDLRALACRRYGWRTLQFISSGFDEPAAQRARGRVFQLALRHRTAGGLAWLRRLHRSHAPEPGPFSTCMHRPDAATVSYTEVRVQGGLRMLSYQSGAPCARAKVYSRTFRSAGRSEVNGRETPN